jgi:hypothetical protein
MPDKAALPTVAAHGATRLPSVDLDSYNVELKDDESFLGDRASKVTREPGPIKESERCL